MTHIHAPAIAICVTITRRMRMSDILGIIIVTILIIIGATVLVTLGVILYYYADWLGDRIERYFAEKELKEIEKFKNKL